MQRPPYICTTHQTQGLWASTRNTRILSQG